MKLKPVVFVQGKYQYHAENTTQQIMLLKALQVTTDPNKLRKIIGVKTIADVYRTLDKIAMRKEYHAALAKQGLSFDYIVKKVKKVIDDETSPKATLAGIGMLLKSIGLDKYEETAIGGGGWEEALLKLNETNEAVDEVTGDKIVQATEIPEYTVTAPEEPEHIRIAKEKANQESKGLYD